jgi:carbon storage regulator
MLVLSRAVNQRIRIGKDIILTVVAVKPGKVWIGVDAPRDVQIYREEILPSCLRSGKEIVSDDLSSTG